jgi:hypothetical protein
MYSFAKLYRTLVGGLKRWPSLAPNFEKDKLKGVFK